MVPNGARWQRGRAVVKCCRDRLLRGSEDPARVLLNSVESADDGAVYRRDSGLNPCGLGGAGGNIRMHVHGRAEVGEDITSEELGGIPQNL